MRLDWQRRAVILFAASLLVLSVILVFFALREAEREKLIAERQVEAASQRLVETIVELARTLVSEAEGRVLEAVKALPPGLETARAAAVLEESLADVPLVSGVFLVDSRDRITSLGARPLYLLPGEKPSFRDVPRSLQNDAFWERAEEAEFRLNDPARAASLYQELSAKSSDPALRTFALNRQARCYAKSAQHAKALAAYAKQLQTGLHDLASEGIPLDITALSQTGNIHLRLEQREGAAAVFLELFQGLVEAKWPLTRDQFKYFRKLAEDRFEGATDGMDVSVRTDWDGRLQDLKEQEDVRLAATEAREKVQERIIPRLRLEAGRPDADPERPARIGEPAEGGLLLASFKPLDPNTTLGMLLDPTHLASRLLSPGAERSGEADPMEGFSAAIIDGSGRTVAARGLPPPDASDKGGEPQRVTTAVFADSFPPWSIEVTESGAGPLERQFRLRRAIYLLALAAVIVALFFGDFGHTEHGQRAPAGQAEIRFHGHGLP
jgi:tetratricopeptide (TPR) repeat protein